MKPQFCYLANNSGLPVPYTSVAEYLIDGLAGVWGGVGIVNGDVLAEVKCHHCHILEVDNDIYNLKHSAINRQHRRRKHRDIS